MAANSYFFDDGESRKFWSYTLRGKKQTIRHGRLGTKGRETVKTFPSPSAAKEGTAKSADQKIAKGYIRVDPSLLKINRPKGKRKATAAQVAKLEQRLGAKLPAEYRDFLLTQNGGEPEPNEVNLPLDGECDSRPVGFLYGLYPKPKPFESLWHAVERTMAFLPEGQLPIAGLFNLYYYSISLDKNCGCVYFWNEDAGGCDVDEVGNPIFDDSHAVLVAGSFDEFLTRVAMYAVPAEESESASGPVEDSYVLPIPDPENGVRLSKRRREEIMQMVYLDDGERDAVTERGEALMQEKSWKAGQALIDRYDRKVRREVNQRLKTTTDKNVLQYSVDNWNWDGGEEPMLAVAKNPHADAGTLLQIYWGSCPEDYCLFHKSLYELDSDSDKNLFRIQRHIERRFLKSEYKTASFSFDPTHRVSMEDRQDEFVRPIPDIMHQPITGRKKRTRK